MKFSEFLLISSYLTMVTSCVFACFWDLSYINIDKHIADYFLLQLPCLFIAKVILASLLLIDECKLRALLLTKSTVIFFFFAKITYILFCSTRTHQNICSDRCLYSMWKQKCPPSLPVCLFVFLFMVFDRPQHHQHGFTDRTGSCFQLDRWAL